MKRRKYYILSTSLLTTAMATLLIYKTIILKEFLLGLLFVLLMNGVFFLFEKKHTTLKTLFTNTMIPFFVFFSYFTVRHSFVQTLTLHISICISFVVHITIFMLKKRKTFYRSVTEGDYQITKNYVERKTLAKFIRGSKKSFIFGLILYIIGVSIAEPQGSIIKIDLSNVIINSATNTYAISTKRFEKINQNKWDEFDEKLKIDFLNAVESKVSQILGIEPMSIEFNDLGNVTLGAFVPNEKKIILHSNYITSNSNLSDALLSLLHEARHSYQAYVIIQMSKIDDLGFVESALFDEARQWRDNNNKYHKANGTFHSIEAYFSQPIEVDASKWSQENINRFLE